MFNAEKYVNSVLNVSDDDDRVLDASTEPIVKS